MFIAPLMIGLLMFSYYPAFSGLYHSFFDWDNVGTATFIGLDNFKELVSDQVFLASIGTMVKIKRKADQKGKIEIDYYSADDLERIIELLGITEEQ